MKRNRTRPIRQFKGIIFDSWRQSHVSDAASKTRKRQWIAHNNTRAQIRNLRHIAAPYLKSKDAGVQAIIARFKTLVKDEPNPEFGLLHLLWAAHDAADQTGETWLTAAQYFADKYENIAADAAAQTTS